VKTWNAGKGEDYAKKEESILISQHKFLLHNRFHYLQELSLELTLKMRASS
jgi:hypothetical protein